MAVVIVRAAIDLTEKPQEQLTEFLRIASQITDSEIALPRDNWRPPSQIQSREMWLYNVQRLWAQMNKTQPPSSERWVHQKSVCVRLQGYDFLEQGERSLTAEGSKVGQAPYALLPLGKEFCDYIRAVREYH